MARKHGYVLVSSARWETESIVEWLNFHRFIGFDHVYLYCNDDEPYELFEAALPFVASGFVDFFHHPIQGQQAAVFTHFMRNYARDCEWICFLDVDEFLLFRHHDTIQDFIDSFIVPPDAIHFNTLNAGHNGHVTRPSGSAIENFPMRSKTVEGLTKCIMRSPAFQPDSLDESFHSMWWHNIADILKPGSKIVNVIGTDMSDYYKDINGNWRIMNTPEFHTKIIDKGAIYHCGMKSEADMIRRFNRGIGGVYDGQVIWKQIHDRGREAILEYLAPLNEVRESRLLQIRARMLAAACNTQLAPPRPGTNIGFKGRATQSSIAATSRFQNNEQDAAGVIDGRPTGAHHHHTSSEDGPWWQVEFGEVRMIAEVRIFNRVDASRDRFRNLMILVGPSEANLRVVDVKNDDVPFGGVDGQMYIWRANERQEAKLVRIQGLGWCHLDLDQVEIYE